MSSLEKLAEIEKLRLAIQEGIGNKTGQEIKGEGKWGARERIRKLLDTNSFVEIGLFMKSRQSDLTREQIETASDGLICGYGTVHGRPIYVYSQDDQILGGSIGEVHMNKIIKTYQEAMKIGVPIIGFIDTAGVRLEEGMDVLAGYGQLFTKMIEASGKIPQITVISGECGGGASVIAGLSDFTLMASRDGKLFLNPPSVVGEKESTYEQMATAKVHAKKGNLIALVEEEEKLIHHIITLLDYLPANNKEEVPCYSCQDDLNRMDDRLNHFDFKYDEPKNILKSIVDQENYFELYEAFGKEVLVAFGRMNGATTGFIVSQEPKLSIQAMDKISKFANQCNHFNIPIVTLTHSTFFDLKTHDEAIESIQKLAKLIESFVNAKVPKINIVLAQLYGTSYVALNSKMIGCDYVYAWPTAEIGLMNDESVMKILYEKALQDAKNPLELLAEKKKVYEKMNDVVSIAARGFIDDIIEPAATRKRIIATLELLATKNKGF